MVRIGFRWAIGSVLLAPLFAVSDIAWSATDAPKPLAAPLISRDSTDAVKLNWAGWAGDKPVSVWMADRPDAAPSKRKLIVHGDRDGGETVATTGTRPYFWVQPRGGKGLWVAERLLPLEGGRNFRDLGGYATSDGKHVRWGMVYRSGAMSGLTPGDYAYLGKLGIRTVCDFRTNDERKAEPNTWVEAAKLDYWTRDYALSMGNLGGMFADRSKLTAETMRAMMTGLYRKFPVEQVPAFREMFAKLLVGKLPLAFNCTAGKDRTGTAAALLLTALGVPYETIMHDFLLSNEMLTPAMLANDKSLSRILGALPPEVSAPLIGVERGYLEAAFDQITKDYGSVESYLERELSVGSKERKALRKKLLG